MIESDGIFVSPTVLKDEPKPEEELGRLLKTAREIGWHRALTEICEPGFVDYVTNPSRLSLTSLLPLNQDDTILEIGPGLGQMSVAIARQVKQLDVIEASLGQARFCKLRTTQEACQNVRVYAGGEAGTLPFPDCSYDGVIMNLVLEWCGIRSNDPHEIVQRRYLSEVHRVLKPGGFFFVSTKNRYSMRLLTGGRDEHLSDLPFGSALPRWLSRVLTKGRQKGRLYSYPALGKMLSAAGFGPSRAFLALPDMRWPKAYLCYDSDLSGVNILTAQMPPRPRLAMKFVPNALLKFVAPGLTFLVRKDG